MNTISEINKLYGKVIFEGRIHVLTGMHIGGSMEFAAIGAVDNVVITDPLTKYPIIPGSTLKGKLRYLLARTKSNTGYLSDIAQESDEIKRLFGSMGDKEKAYVSRLQFFDLFINEESVEAIKKADTDLYVTEIKFENTISRSTAQAMPRQIERVPAGTVFDLKLIYNIENEEEFEQDMTNLFEAIALLEHDYIGGHGTRGYGRIKIDISHYECKFAQEETVRAVEEILKTMLQ